MERTCKQERHSAPPRFFRSRGEPHPVSPKAFLHVRSYVWLRTCAPLGLTVPVECHGIFPTTVRITQIDRTAGRSRGPARTCPTTIHQHHNSTKLPASLNIHHNHVTLESPRHPEKYNTLERLPGTPLVFGDASSLSGGTFACTHQSSTISASYSGTSAGLAEKVAPGLTDHANRHRATVSESRLHQGLTDLADCHHTTDQTETTAHSGSAAVFTYLFEGSARVDAFQAKLR
jgi:hypothetical protein